MVENKGILLMRLGSHGMQQRRYNFRRFYIHESMVGQDDIKHLTAAADLFIYFLRMNEFIHGGLNYASSS